MSGDRARDSSRVGLGVGALLVASVLALAANGASFRAPSSVSPTAGQTGPPPPLRLAIYLPRFEWLLSSYIASGASGDISFAEWIARLGIVDAETHRAMLMLYWWWLRTG